MNGKARLVSDKYCDGLGACLGECPQGAITIIEREADEFNEEAVKKYLGAKDRHSHSQDHNLHGFSCPGSTMRDLRKTKDSDVNIPRIETQDVQISIKSQLMQWPVQLMLVPVEAPYFEGTDLLITADCVAVAYPNYHLSLLRGKSVVVGCPKLDDGNYMKKLAEIIKRNDIKSITEPTWKCPVATV